MNGHLLPILARSLSPGAADAGETDRDLLARFARDRDQAAFAVLVNRHAPMALAVCQRVLGNRADAEDACQAAFVVLARKAGSVRWRTTVGGWLYKTARQVALNARTARRRRGRHERRAAARVPENPLAVLTGEELLAAMDEELARLPDRYRGPLVLCCLEGLAREDAAGRLGVSPGTLKVQLERARERLRAALAKRGIELGSALLTLAVSAGAGAARPPLTALIVAAAGGDVRPAVAALASGSSLMSKSKLLVAVGVAAALAGAAAVGGGPSGPPGARANPPMTSGGGVADRPAGKAPADDRPGGPARGEGAATHRGRVLGPDGRPIAGAKVFHTPARVRFKDPPPAAGAVATSGPDGRFEFQAPGRPFGSRFAHVAAAAAGYGPGWVEVEADSPHGDLTVRLAGDDAPVAGTLLDLEGKPVKGTTVTVLSVAAPPGDDLDRWTEAVKGGKGKGAAPSEWPLALAYEARAITDAEGRFRLTGLGQNRVARVRIDGPGVASQYVHVLTRAGASFEVVEVPGRPVDGVPPRKVTYHGATFRHVTGPSRPVAGVVRDADTGKPLAGVVVESNRLGNDPVPGNNIVRTTTDAAGRYRLTGLPKVKGNLIRFVPPEELPYVSVHAAVPDGPGLEPVTVDFSLRRGVWVEGRVTDKATGKPVGGAVLDYLALDKNPNVPDYPGFERTEPPVRGQVQTGADGTYRVAGLPGPGLVTVYRAEGYLPASDRDDEYAAGEDVYAYPFPLTGSGANHAAVARVDPAKGASARRDITLDPGRTLSGTVVGPDGRPLAGAVGFGLNDRAPAWNRGGIDGAEFVARALSPRRPRPLLFRHPAKGLVGIAEPPKAAPTRVEVRLGPGAEVSGRVVDAGGKPRAEADLGLWFRPAGAADWAAYLPDRVRTDREGRFRITGLAPGYEFRLSDGPGEVPLGSAPADGQASDRGDVRVGRPGR